MSVYCDWASFFIRQAVEEDRQIKKILRDLDPELRQAPQESSDGSNLLSSQNICSNMKEGDSTKTSHPLVHAILYSSLKTPLHVIKNECKLDENGEVDVNWFNSLDEEQSTRVEIAALVQKYINLKESEESHSTASRKDRRKWAKQLKAISDALYSEVVKEEIDEENRRYSAMCNTCLCYANSVLHTIMETTTDETTKSIVSDCVEKIIKTMNGEIPSPWVQ